MAEDEHHGRNTPPKWQAWVDSHRELEQDSEGDEDVYAVSMPEASSYFKGDRDDIGRLLLFQSIQYDLPVVAGVPKTVSVDEGAVDEEAEGEGREERSKLREGIEMVGEVE